MIRAASVYAALTALVLGGEPPDIRTFAPDLLTPPMTEGAPAAGRRVRDLNFKKLAEGKGVFFAFCRDPDSRTSTTSRTMSFLLSSQ